MCGKRRHKAEDTRGRKPAPAFALKIGADLLLSVQFIIIQQPVNSKL